MSAFRAAWQRLKAALLPSVNHGATITPQQSHTPLVANQSDAGYREKLNAELETFSGQAQVHELPDIYHYWSGKFLAPKLAAMGFAHPDDFFQKKLALAWNSTASLQKRFISVGAGNCDTEIRVARALVESGKRDFTIECLEINSDMLDRGRQAAAEAGLSTHLEFAQGDFNLWQSSGLYDGVMANHSLHHVVELEYLFESVRTALAPGARFVVADMIGRNGHQLWPEAMAIVDKFWKELPDHYRFNVQLNRREQTYLDWDCSSVGFEGVRAQDILPLLLGRFEFETFLPFANAVQPFVGRAFGHHFRADREWDREFIDRVHAADEAAILSGEIKPTQMLAVMSLDRPSSRQFMRGLTPEFCVRDTVAS